MTFTVILLNLQSSFKKLECSHGGVSLFAVFLLISLFISIKDKYSLALAGEHFVTVPIILPSFRKRFRTCKNRLFSHSIFYSFLKDARIWNEGLANNFKEAHVFFSCFSGFIQSLPSSHMKTYPEAPLEQVLLLNPIAGGTNAHKVNGL